MAAKDMDDLADRYADRGVTSVFIYSPLYTERVAWRPDVADEFRKGLERNGPQAVTDFYK